MLQEADEEGQNALKRHLNGTSLIMLGVGATIGAGIFLLTTGFIICTLKGTYSKNK